MTLLGSWGDQTDAPGDDLFWQANQLAADVISTLNMVGVQLDFWGWRTATLLPNLCGFRRWLGQRRAVILASGLVVRLV